MMFNLTHTCTAFVQRMLWLSSSYFLILFCWFLTSVFLTFFKATTLASSFVNRHLNTNKCHPFCGCALLLFVIQNNLAFVFIVIWFSRRWEALTSELWRIYSLRRPPKRTNFDLNKIIKNLNDLAFLLNSILNSFFRNLISDSYSGWWFVRWAASRKFGQVFRFLSRWASIAWNRFSTKVKWSEWEQRTSSCGWLRLFAVNLPVACERRDSKEGQHPHQSSQTLLTSFED